MNPSALGAILLIQSIMIVILTVLLLCTIRQVGTLSLRLGPMGSRTIDAGPALDTSHVASPFLATLKNTATRNEAFLLTFLTPGCSSCILLLPAIRAVAKEQRGRFIVVILLRARDEISADQVRRSAGAEVRVLVDDTLFDGWSIEGTPYSVALSPDLTIKGKGISNTLEHLQSLVNTLDLDTPTAEQWILEHVAPPINAAATEETYSGS